MTAFFLWDRVMTVTLPVRRTLLSFGIELAEYYHGCMPVRPGIHLRKGVRISEGSNWSPEGALSEARSEPLSLSETWNGMFTGAVIAAAIRAVFRSVFRSSIGAAWLTHGLRNLPCLTQSQRAVQ